MQRTEFDFNIIVADDCSTDGSVELLLEYDKIYPGKFVLLLGEHVGGTANLKRVIEASSCKYIALCDGDDYWIDSYKLQKQVELLEQNTNFVGCFHNVINKYEHTKFKSSYFLSSDFPVDNDWKRIVEEKWFMPINGIVFKREYAYFPDWYSNVMNDDYVLNLMIARHGNFHYMPDVMAVYRHNSKSESNQYANELLINKNLRYILQQTKEEYPLDSHIVFDKKIAQFDSIIAELELFQRQPWRKYFRIKTYKRLIKKIINKFR